MPSFDIVSELDLQEIDNAVNQVDRELTQRYDFKGTQASIEFDRKNSTITLKANSEQKLETIVDILQSKVIKRGLDIKSLKPGKAEAMGGQMQKIVIELIEGIDKEQAKKITKFIKDTKMKVQASIQDDKVRVTGKKRDDLQEAIQALKQESFELPLQYNNFRD